MKVLMRQKKFYTCATIIVKNKQYGTVYNTGYGIVWNFKQVTLRNIDAKFQEL